MRFLRRIAGILGFAKDEIKDDEEEASNSDADASRVNSNLPRKGFSIAVPVAVERPQLGPVLVPCSVGSGGIQGLKWYARRLRVDEDGDVADEFLSETLPETLDQHQRFPRFEVKYNAIPAKVRNQVLGPNGTVQQRVEYKGKLQWV